MIKRCSNCDEETPAEELDENELCPDCADEAEHADEKLGEEEGL